MTAEEIQRLPAGRELDALVAERVFQFPVLWRTGAPYASRTMNPLRSYSSSVGDAWRVIEWLHRNDWRFSIQTSDSDAFYAEVSRLGLASPYYEAWGDTAPLAICRAALLAVAA